MQLYCFDLMLRVCSKNPDRLKTKMTSSTSTLGVTVAYTQTHRHTHVGFVYVARPQSLVLLWSDFNESLEGLVSFRTVHKLTDTHPLRLRALTHHHKSLARRIQRRSRQVQRLKLQLLHQRWITHAQNTVLVFVRARGES